MLLELAINSKLAGYEVTVGVFENSKNPNVELARAARDRGLDVQIFPCKGRLDKNTVGLIRAYLKNADVRIIHSHNYKSNFYTRIALRNHDVRWVVTKHGRRSGLKLFLYNFSDIFVVRKADRIVAVSEKIYKRLSYLGISVNRLCTIHNGINFHRFLENIAPRPTRESFGINSDHTVVGTVGSITKEKGHVYLMRAALKVMEYFPQTTLLFVGDGKERLQLQEMSKELRITNKVIFAGTRRDISGILSLLDIFVLPSLKEGLPMALLEACAAKVPIVATSVGAIPKVLDDGVSGLLVPPKNPEAIAEAIIRILSDKNVASKLANRASKRVRGSFSSKKMAHQYLSIYQELLFENK